MDEFIMQQERMRQDGEKQEELDRINNERIAFEQELERQK